MAPETYVVGCWNCLSDFDALGAVWCSHDPKNPTKLCPFCFRCFCAASERYKQEFWRHAPLRLQEELATLQKSKDRLGDVLIRMSKLTTPQLLDALLRQREGGGRLGEILVAGGLVREEDVAAALRLQGARPLADTRGVDFSSTPVWERSSPDAIIQYLLALAARKGASDVQIEPGEHNVGVKYRIDGFFFRVDPIPKAYQKALTQRMLEVFRLDPAREGEAQGSRLSTRIGETEYDLVIQTLPTPHGISATIKLVDRAAFVKDLTALGMEVEDRVRLMEELARSFGLVLVTAPVFNGANTTCYSIMSFLARGQRDVVSLEAPVYQRLDGVRQVEVPADGPVARMEEALRTVLGVRPEVLVLSAVPDRASAVVAAQLASSMLVVASLPAPTASQGVSALLHQDLPPQMVAGSLGAVTCQRLVRQICRICRESAERPAPQTLAHHGIGPEEAETLHFFKGRGCPTCNRVGYRGRRAIF
ncbi:MAG TPA: ATPase, T2SS/T4P/T4SS family, partial [Vicinamibacteria bacterium]|nr:ATPase, T2SS/T4P/T4SS family [Vicinamibacteria bacterium]